MSSTESAKPNRPLMSILSDQPAEKDQLNFRPYAKTLADIIADPYTRTPLTVGVFGGWGRGKTSLMRMVQHRLEDHATDAEFPVRTVWFNAWLYSHQPALWRALISRVLDGARGFPTLGQAAQAELDQLEARLYGATASTGGHLTLPAGALAGLGGAALPPLMGLELLRRRAERAGKGGAARTLETLIADVEESDAQTRREQIVVLDDFRRQFEGLSRDCIVDHGRLAVFVDDLGRCLPDKAVAVLEAVNLFLDVPGCVFVLGVAREVIEEGIRVRYQDYETQLDGAHYLEKIIQIPFALPPIAPEDVSAYVREVTRESLPDPRCETVFTVGLEPNPRRIKRTLNIFSLLWRLAQNRPDLRAVIKPVRLAKIVIIQSYHPRLFRLITAGPHYLIDLEQRFREGEALSTEHVTVVGRGFLANLRQLLVRRFSETELRNLCFDLQVSYDNLSGDNKNDKARELVAYCERRDQIPLLLNVGQQLRPDVPWPGEEDLSNLGNDVDRADTSAGPLSEFLGRSLLRNLLTCTAADEPDANFADLGPAGVREYIYLTRSTVEEPAAAAAGAEEALPFEPQMVSIPAGAFLMGTPESELDEIEKLGMERERIEREVPQHEVTLADYAIGRYPVTNAEFARFIVGGGYEQRGYWTEAGWRQKESEGWTQPRYSDEDDFQDPSQPVMGVSWYEALAYCNWLAVVTGKPYRLPSEAEWEKAARGTDGRRYPWGSEWDKGCCNSEEGGLGCTAPVGQYPDGDSPYGVGDMVGQVWEWCNSKYGGLDPQPRFGYPYRSDDGREELAGDDTRISRGGAFGTDKSYCRCSSRLGNLPGVRGGDGGFRCARDLF